MNKLAMTAMLVLVAALSSATPAIGSTMVLITTTSDLVNGDTSSVAALIANPGPSASSYDRGIALPRVIAS